MRKRRASPAARSPLRLGDKLSSAVTRHYVVREMGLERIDSMIQVKIALRLL